MLLAAVCTGAVVAGAGCLWVTRRARSATETTGRGRVDLPWEVDSIVPEEWFARRRAGLTREKRLLLAVLEDAVHTIGKNAHASAPAAIDEVRETRQWIESDRVDHPFAFRAICEELAFNVDYLRAGLRRYPSRRRAAERA